MARLVDGASLDPRPGGGLPQASFTGIVVDGRTDSAGRAGRRFKKHDNHAYSHPNHLHDAGCHRTPRADRRDVGGRRRGPTGRRDHAGVGRRHELVVPEFSINNWGYDNRTLVVSNVFATDGNGTNTRVGPFLPSDEYPAVGTRLEPHDSLTFKVSRTVLGNHGLSVLLYDPNNTKDTVQVWMKAQVFSAYSEAKSTRGVVMCYGDHVVIYANDPLGS